jgi:serine protease
MPLYTPNDPRYNEQWHYYETTGGIDLPAAWDLTQGENSVVAVVDTGYLPHQDLLPNILPGYDMVSNLTMANDGDGRDDDPLDPGDYAPLCDMPRSSWHGTHVAGTVAAVGNNGIGVTGIAFRAQLLPVRVLGKCGGYLSDISDGIVWASGAEVSGTPRNPYPANVISMSLGGPSSICPQTFQRAIDTARQQGATVVVAAGNESKDSASTTPANCKGVISVAASTRTGERASFSNYGDLVDIAAPGEDILSTYNNGIIAPRNDSYVYLRGTSMATPHVSGVAALLYAVKPGITPDQVEQILKQTARPFPNPCAGCGSGILDAAAAVERASTVADISYQNSADYPIVNFRYIGTSSPIEVPLDGESGNIDVRVDIKHPDISELIVALSDPLGQIHLLKRFGGQQATDLNETYALNNGQLQAAGTWQLRVFDFGSRGDGYIDNWSITFHR